LSIDPTCKYQNIVYIRYFSEEFTLVGGINAPKLIKCYGSDGLIYKQLVKSKDDLRQDAVMQQMFSLVNNLLHSNLETRKRKLIIRTYKVIPLSPNTGILEWVENTIPIGEYLIGNPKNPKNGAHVRYRPNDKSSDQCKKEFKACQKDKFNKFLVICENFKPVFHHFFLENFFHPVEWFEKRLTYTRSVASNSIVGYIVGLGDRHPNNILIDKKTAELIHIDLGVAFEQGKILRVPELVPFRLTRDIIDGMGITGYEGVFRRCCEETMKVLRNNYASLITIFEVFLYDPLYQWNLSPPRVLQLQYDDEIDLENNNIMENIIDDNYENTTRNIDAEKTLLRLKQKLQGYEYGELLSVEGQINQLIYDATDNEKLCKIFYGWAPWL
jgi:ataxia telangiectasia mutated family protein